MDVIDIYRREYQYYLEHEECLKTKYEWAATEIFGIVAHDSELYKEFVKSVIEVCMVIESKTIDDYISDRANYIKYIIVCNLLNNARWIWWKNSITNAYFDEFTSEMPKPILSYSRYDKASDKGIDIFVRFSVSNLSKLIEFIEEDC